MGTVHRAWDPDLARSVAIKVIQSQDLDEQVIERFRREAQALAKVPHPHIVAVYDVGTSGGTPFIVMELIEGQSLASVIRQGIVYSTDEKLRVTMELCAALACAHEGGIIHRDIKPANILITEGRQAKLVDFGLARLQDSTLTGTSYIVGTPAYLAPEAFSGREVDARADIYGVSASLYEWLCGKRPYEADNAVTQAAQVAQFDAPDIRDRWTLCPASLANCLKRGLARSPSDRYQTAIELAEAIRVLMPLSGAEPASEASTVLVSSSPSTRNRRLGAAMVLLAGAAAVVLILVVAATTSSPASPPVVTAVTNLANSELPGPTVAPASIGVPAPEKARTVPVRDTSSNAAPVASTEVPPPAILPTVDEEVSVRPAMPVGTKVMVTIVTELRTDRAAAGQEFEARLASPLLWEGRAVIAVGAAIRGTVDAVVSGDHQSSPSLQLSLTEIVIDGVPAPIRTARYEVVGPEPTAGQSRAITLILGAVAGAATGVATGGTKGGVIGGVVGAAALARSRPPVNGEYLFAQALTFKLVEPLSLRLRTQQGGK